MKSWLKSQKSQLLKLYENQESQLESRMKVAWKSTC